MHDGTTPFEGVVNTVEQLKKANKEIIILSNSSKREEHSFKSLTKLGFDTSCFKTVVTSGEVSYHLLQQNGPDDHPLAPQPWSILDSVVNNQSCSKNVFCFGSGSEDEEYIKLCGWRLSDLESADIIVARGTFTIMDGKTVVDRTEDGEDAYQQSFQKQLKSAAKRRIPMIVANPDKVRPDGNRSPMPGKIGDEYEKLLGGSEGSDLIKRIGKPFDDVYEIALRGKDKSRVCMVGDALETDVFGAHSQGIDGIWVVNNGIHNAEIAKAGNGDLLEGCAAILEEFNSRKDTYANGAPLSPAVVVPHFRW
jgi:ribonucleotide monophosphatase NagD (HAD superfamily)